LGVSVAATDALPAEVVMSTTLDKFRGAALSLARSGPIKDRLTAAYRDHLARVEESELPRELVAEFRALNTSLNRERPTSRLDDALRATVRKMSSTEADEVASSVVRLYGAMSAEDQSSLNSIVSQRVVSSWRA
jgi:hypothetical protein